MEDFVQIRCANGHDFLTCDSRVGAVIVRPDFCSLCSSPSFRRYDNDVQRIQHLFRPDEETRIIVPDVIFTWKRSKGEFVTARASFRGVVKDLSVVADAHGQTAILTMWVQLCVRKDLNFRFVRPCKGDNCHLVIERDADDQRYYVSITLRDGDWENIARGWRCKKRHEGVCCDKHNLGDIDIKTK